MKLPYVACVNYPRSGHHLLVRLLNSVIGENFRYCSFYNAKQCCGVFPCNNSKINMSKQHDFNLDSNIPTDTSYIVQYRSFLDAVVSNFELHIGAHPQRDNPRGFALFAWRQQDWYNKWLKKWALGEDANRLLLPYATLIERPDIALQRVAKLFGIDLSGEDLRQYIDSEDHLTVRAGKIIRVRNEGVIDRRDVTTFRFYDPLLFDDLTDATDPVIDQITESI